MSDFVPAESKLEAVSRIYALAGAPAEGLGPGSTEKKSVLTVLAAALGLPTDEKKSKPVLGGQIAELLQARWGDDCFSTGSTITLRGLNLLLEAASAELERRSIVPRPLLPELLNGWDGFAPARTKLEVVNRIASLTGSGPEELGPGSKERKSVLLNLARGLNIHHDPAASKTRLGQQIARDLGVGWNQSCYSMGETITLDGLNVLLAGAERRTGRMTGRGVFGDIRAEADALLGALDGALPDDWAGRECCTEMRDAHYRHWRQTEWPGWYFEYKGIPALIDTYGGGPEQVARVEFDYRLDTVWDLKCHSSHAGDSAPLNDKESMLEALQQGPLGLLVVSGDSHYDHSFREWHREFRDARPRAVGDTRPSRALKSGYMPTRFDALVLRNTSHYDANVAAGVVSTMKQGRQARGDARRPKLRIDLAKAARSDLLVARIERD